MDSWIFEVHGKPVPKGRPRFNRATGRTYTPERSRKYEQNVATVAAFRRPAGWPFDARYRVKLTAWCPTKRRVDVDNVAKSVLDALNGIAFDDDSRVVDLHVTRELDRERPRVRVEIEVVE